MGDCVTGGGKSNIIIQRDWTKSCWGHLAFLPVFYFVFYHPLIKGLFSKVRRVIQTYSRLCVEIIFSPFNQRFFTGCPDLGRKPVRTIQIPVTKGHLQEGVFCTS